MIEELEMKYYRRVRRQEVFGLRAWLLHIWCDDEKWRPWIKPDGIRILGFEWNRWEFQS